MYPEEDISKRIRLWRAPFRCDSPFAAPQDSLEIKSRGTQDAVRSSQAKLRMEVLVIDTDQKASRYGGKPAKPVEALGEYCEKMVVSHRLVVEETVSNGFTVASPEDIDLIDLVGLQTASPGLIAEFSRGAG